MLPKGFETPEKVALAIMLGMEVGLSPAQSLQSIMVVNNRPTIWGDAALALVRSSGLLEDIAETYTDAGPKSVATCTVKRKGQATPISRSFSMADAIRAGLAGKDLYKLYPQRMLPARARAFALRDGFADVLKGLAVREEVEDYQPTGAAVVQSHVDQAALPGPTPDKIDALIDEPSKPSAPTEMTEAEKAAIVAAEIAANTPTFPLV